MSDNMLSALPNKLDYRDNRSIPENLNYGNVLDFERLSVRLWNKQNHTKRESRLFNKLMAWHNLYLARTYGYEWCHQCRDKGYRYLPRGILKCSCAFTGHIESKRVKITHVKRVRGIDCTRRNI